MEGSRLKRRVCNVTQIYTNAQKASIVTLVFSAIYTLMRGGVLGLDSDNHGIRVITLIVSVLSTT